MKSCLVVAGCGEIGSGVGRMAGYFNLAEAESDHGFHVYETDEPDAPDIAVLDMERLDARDCAEKIRHLGHDRNLTLFCATDGDRIRIQQIFGGQLSIKPFDMGVLCAQMSACAHVKTGRIVSARM